MRILLTGATSFTGAWFARSLAERGHSVVAAIRGNEGSYGGLKAARLASLPIACELAWGQSFGTPQFVTLIADAAQPFDVICHHAAETSNYRSPDFDILAATAMNTYGLRNVLEAFQRRGGRKLVLSGSVFEMGEGAGSMPMEAFSGYGLSKSLTASIFAFYAQQFGLALEKFVIANPFGPLEEPRFTDYLLRCWKDGKKAIVNTPLYVRDNIHVSLLARAYADFVSQVSHCGFRKCNPSWYVESQGAFALRFAREIGQRLALDSEVEMATQVDFSEPIVRINTDRPVYTDWDEAAAWDHLAMYYSERFGIAGRC